MRVPALLVAVAISVPVVAQDLARELLDRFHAVAWNSVATPAEASAWGSTTWPDNDGLACFRHQQRSGGVEWNDDYYALDPAAPACRVLRFRVSTRELSQQELGPLSYAMMDALNLELGPSRDPGRVRAWGAASWRSIRQWDRDGYRILLFINEGYWPETKPPRVEILVEHQEMVRASAAAFAVTDPYRGRNIRAELEAALRAERGDETLLNIESLERTWRQYENTPQGEAAFVLLQENGWYFGKSCPEDSIYFPKVIENGERFLINHASSPHRLETIFQLAQAYEDWWNAGLAPLEGVYSQMPREPYQPRMQEMRLKAIASYEQILSAEPQSFRGRWAALRVPRLKLGMHTDRFRFVDSCH